MVAVHRPASADQLTLTDTLSANFVPDQINADWVRWCFASINTHFEGMRGGYELYIEGDERTQLNEAEFAELRIDGPFILVPQKKLYYLDVEINILCQTHLDPRKHYKAQVMVGAFLRAFRNLIPVYKYGDGPFDDNSLLECFHLQRDLRERVNINYFGIIRPDSRVIHTTIEGHYRLELWTQGD